MRLDLYLVQKKLASSRTHAQELIKTGQVYQQNPDGSPRVLQKANHQVDEQQTDIYVSEGPANRFVSRGGLKLEGALQRLRLDVNQWQVLDVGISTGGFTDCLLQKGAAQVVGVDVGHGQTHPSLLLNPRLRVIEGLNARELTRNSELQAFRPREGFDLIVMDVSFISISLILPQLLSFLKPQGHLLSLVKPQFEVGPEGLGKGGLVKDPGLYSQIENKIKSACERSGFQTLDYFESSIEGKDGNKEFFIFVQKNTL